MQTWLIVLLYVLVALVYAVLQQLFFRFRYKELAFTFGFLAFVSFVVMISTKFSDLFVWLTVANVALEAAVAVYVAVLMRRMRDKVMRQMQQPNVEDMFKNLFSGGNPFGGLGNMFPGAGEGAPEEKEEPDIIVTEEKSEESGEHADDPSYYEVGDVIIDDEEKQDEENDTKDR